MGTRTIPVATVESVGHLVEYISKRLTTERTADDSGIFWFRGHRSCTWNVQPSIWRDYDKYSERNFTNRFCVRAATRYQSLPTYDQDALWLSLMQHYGLPTRLLDWTRSPLVALYFAVEGYILDQQREPEPALIWMLDPHLLNRSEAFADVTPSIEAHGCQNMISAAFTHRVEENNKVRAVTAAENDLRMFVQQGCFTIHSDPEPLNFRDDCGAYLSSIVIPGKHVRRVAFEVDVCGFRQGDIFPDLGHLADELKATWPPTKKHR
jgi:hypothetical protein